MGECTLPPPRCNNIDQSSNRPRILCTWHSGYNAPLTNPTPASTRSTLNPFVAVAWEIWGKSATPFWLRDGAWLWAVRGAANSLPRQPGQSADKGATSRPPPRRFLIFGIDPEF